MLKLWRSTSMRLALAFAMLFIVSSLLLVGLLWWVTADYLDRETAAVIRADTQSIEDDVSFRGVDGAAATLEERDGQSAEGRAVVVLANPALKVIAGNLTAWPQSLPTKPGWYQRLLALDGNLRLMQLYVTALPGGMHLLIGRDIEDRVEIRALIVDGLGWAAAGAFLIAILGGVLVRRAVLLRVEIINRAATAIVQGDLSRRLPTRDTTDEFDQLAQTINLMLLQIERLIDGVRNTSSSIAHDLRTPLAELRARLEGIIRDRPATETTFEEIHRAVADIDRVIGIFNALLRLAEIDLGVRRSGFRSVELAEITTEIAELYGPVIEEKGTALVIDVPHGLVVSGDPFLLAEAVANLVDNAAKYTSRGGVITVRVRQAHDRQVEIVVADHGVGIEASEKASVTSRFYRGGSAKGTSGVGLGLSVVEAVARLHGGMLELGDNRPGLVATLRIATGISPVNLAEELAA